MKTSFFSLFALTGLFASSCVASPVANAVAVEKRQSDAALSIVTDLLSTIQGFDATINSTIAGVSPSSSADDQAAASTTVNGIITEITDAVNSAIASVQAIPVSKRDNLAVRQTATPTEITLVLEEILEELSNTLNGVIASLGLTSLLGFLTPLTTALGGLIAALEVVVDDLLAVVEELLNGILTGLSVALDGLVL